jgi:transglutaminase-like putative cysteine protease
MFNTNPAQSSEPAPGNPRDRARYFIHHRTEYHYSAPVSISHHAACLCPSNSETQTLQRFSLFPSPPTSNISEHQDYFGNTRHQFSITTSHDLFSVDMLAIVQKLRGRVPDLGSSPTCAEVLAFLGDSQDKEAIQASEFTHVTPLTVPREEFEEFAAQVLQPERPYLEGVMELCRNIFDTFEFDPEATDLNTPLEEFWQQKGGVCQDFAHFAISCLRSVGFAAGYVSGYILTHPPQGRPRLEGADATHAWISVYTPGLGWVDFDPTNALLCNIEHIQVARGRDYQDVSPIKGAVSGGGEQDISVSVTVMPDSEENLDVLWDKRFRSVQQQAEREQA